MIVAGETDRDRAHPLRAFLRVDQAACVVSVLPVFVVAVVRNEPYLLVVGGAVALTAVGLGVARYLLDERGETAAVWALAVANWTVTIVASSIVVFIMPLMVLSSLLPAVVAASYVSARRLRVIAIVSMVVCVLCASLATLQDFSHLSERLPTWIKDAVLIGFVPFVAGLILVTAFQSHRRLTVSLDEALLSNRLLRESERKLEVQAAELVASRTRLVNATDRERRRIERDLHDGAQQRLVALAVRLRLASRLVQRDPDACRSLLEELVSEAQAGVAELRDLAHGVFPPVLAENGLVAAIEEVATRMPVACRVVATADARVSATVEAAVYFACLEGIQNAVKHAGDRARVTVRLDYPIPGTAETQLRFEVQDDGAGFNGDGAGRGAGLDNMADRIGAVGGTLSVRSTPGEGTIVSGTVPL